MLQLVTFSPWALASELILDPCSLPLNLEVVYEQLEIFNLGENIYWWKEDGITWTWPTAKDHFKHFCSPKLRQKGWSAWQAFIKMVYEQMRENTWTKLFRESSWDVIGHLLKHFQKLLSDGVGRWLGQSISNLIKKVHKLII